MRFNLVPTLAVFSLFFFSGFDFQSQNFINHALAKKSDNSGKGNNSSAGSNAGRGNSASNGNDVSGSQGNQGRGKGAGKNSDKGNAGGNSGGGNSGGGNSGGGNSGGGNSGGGNSGGGNSGGGNSGGGNSGGGNSGGGNSGGGNSGGGNSGGGNSGGGNSGGTPSATPGKSPKGSSTVGVLSNNPNSVDPILRCLDGQRGSMDCAARLTLKSSRQSLEGAMKYHSQTGRYYFATYADTERGVNGGKEAVAAVADFSNMANGQIVLLGASTKVKADRPNHYKIPQPNILNRNRIKTKSIGGCMEDLGSVDAEFEVFDYSNRKWTVEITCD